MKKQMKLARLWDGARREMLKQQYAAPEARAERFGKLVRHLKVDGLWLNAAVGTGTPALAGLDEKTDGKRLVLSDGDDAFLALLSENYPSWHAQHAFWHELHQKFGRGTMGAVEISGNSLGYAVSWKDGASARALFGALEESVAAVFAVLERRGKFVFDIARYGQGRHEIGSGYWMGLEYGDGLRRWTVGDGKRGQTRAGLMLDAGIINSILGRVGFSEARQAPLQLDPRYYELWFAEKK